MKKALLMVGAVVLIAIAAGGFYIWKSYSGFMAVEAIVLDPQLTVYTGSCNSVVLTSPDGNDALVIDTKMKGAAQKLQTHVRAKNITIVNTHDHFDHVGGNALFGKAPIIAGAYSREQWDRDSRKTGKYPDTVLKPGEEKVLAIGDETIHIVNMGRAHTFNDVVVYLEKRKLLATGDLVFRQMHPALIVESGTKVSAWISALEALSEKYDIKTLVPGHGPLADQNALAEMKDYFIAAGDAVGNPEKQTAAQNKYQTYFSIPGTFSFGHTVKFIDRERKETK